MAGKKSIHATAVVTKAEPTAKRKPMLSTDSGINVHLLIPYSDQAMTLLAANLRATFVIDLAVQQGNIESFADASTGKGNKGQLGLVTNELTAKKKTTKKRTTRKKPTKS